MKNPIKLILLCMAAAVTLSSCLKGDNELPYDDVRYMTIEEDGASYYFIDDLGNTYFPNNTSDLTITEEHYGQRIIVYFKNLKSGVSDVHKNITAVRIDGILSLDIASVDNTPAEDIDTQFGDDAIEIADARIQGKWLDMVCYFAYPSDGDFEITLLDNRTVENPPVPGGAEPGEYQYLEFRLKLDPDAYANQAVQSYVSFRIPDGYTTGKKGMYIRVEKLNGSGYDYVKIDVPASGNN